VAGVLRAAKRHVRLSGVSESPGSVADRVTTTSRWRPILSGLVGGSCGAAYAAGTQVPQAARPTMRMATATGGSTLKWDLNMDVLRRR